MGIERLPAMIGSRQEECKDLRAVVFSNFVQKWREVKPRTLHNSKRAAPSRASAGVWLQSGAARKRRPRARRDDKNRQFCD